MRARPAGPAFPPPIESRPCYVVIDEWLEVGKEKRKFRPGVYYCEYQQATEKKEAVIAEIWICSPLHLDATTFDGQQNNFGRLLRFQNSIGQWRQWAMPMDMLRGSGEELRGELLAMGVAIDPYRRSNRSETCHWSWQRSGRATRAALRDHAG